MGRLQAQQGINPERKVKMALARDFKDTVAARVQNDPAFAQALLKVFIQVDEGIGKAR